MTIIYNYTTLNDHAVYAIRNIYNCLIGSSVKNFNYYIFVLTHIVLQ